jgi:hypothetical protein
MRHLLPALLCCLAGLAAAADTPTDVPDPYGLGERLALIDWLRSRRVEVAEGAELADLRARYRAAQQAPAADPGSDREAAALELWRRHGVSAEPGVGADEIRRRIAALDLQQAQLEAIELERQRADAARHADDRETTTRPHDAEPIAARPQPAPPAALALAEVRELARPRDMGERVRAFLVSPESSPILIVVCDPDLLGLERILAHWPAQQRLAAGVDGTVIIHGHSDGGVFNVGVMKEAGALGGDLAEHLRRNREYYETMGGTRAAKAIDLAVMTGCNLGGFNEERELKDGLGYRPLHRVFTVPESLDATGICLPAIVAAGVTAFDRLHPLRATYRFAEQIVDHQGKKRQAACYAVVDDEALDIHDHLRRYLVSRTGVTEEP